MLKLYKNINGVLHYWETWDKDKKTGLVHSGILGERGEVREVKSTPFSSFKKEIQKEITSVTNNGFAEMEDLHSLLIEFEIEGMGSVEDLDKRTRLENRMNETLGWTGLGHCDGGSIGSGTMEVCCLVVDMEIAKRVIKEDLENTEFANYTRIFDEDEE